MKPIERIRITKTKKLKYSTATYIQKNGKSIVDLKELAEKISKWEMGPEKLNFTRASEFVLLAREYLIYREMESKLLKKRKKK